jgi:hypothetical protein
MLNFYKPLAIGLFVATLSGGLALRADTTEIFTGSCGPSCGDSTAGMTLSATAAFDLSTDGHTLTITLANTASTPVRVPADILTGVFFNVNPGVLSSGTASLGSGSEILNGDGTVNNSAIVGNYWGYASGVSAQGKSFAISASGAVNDLGHANFGDGSALQGVGGGTVTGIANNANGGVTGKGPYFDNSIVFTFHTSNFTLADLGNSVVFQYGTDLSETHYSGTVTAMPETSTLATLLAYLVLSSVAGVLYRRYRRGHQTPSA